MRTQSNVNIIRPYQQGLLLRDGFKYQLFKWTTNKHRNQMETNPDFPLAFTHLHKNGQKGPEFFLVNYVNVHNVNTFPPWDVLMLRTSQSTCDQSAPITQESYFHQASKSATAFRSTPCSHCIRSEIVPSVQPVQFVLQISFYISAQNKEMTALSFLLSLRKGYPNHFKSTIRACLPLNYCQPLTD